MVGAVSVVYELSGNACRFELRRFLYAVATFRSWLFFESSSCWMELLIARMSIVLGLLNFSRAIFADSREVFASRTCL